MNPDTERWLKAYLEVYRQFEHTYRDFYNIDQKGPLSSELVPELAKLFEIAWNDSMLGVLLREEVMKEYQGLANAEQLKREAEEEAEAGEAMII